MTRALAAQAGLALELAEVCQVAEERRLAEDRAGIAEDLRQRVIQRLFDVGLALQGAASRVVKPDVRDTIETQINAIDTIIREVRASVFSLDRSPVDPAGETDSG